MLLNLFPYFAQNMICMDVSRRVVTRTMTFACLVLHSSAAANKNEGHLLLCNKVEQDVRYCLSPCSRDVLKSVR